MGKFNKIISRRISSSKGEHWELDESISDGYLLSFFAGKFLMLFNGFLTFFRFRNPIYIGKGTIIKAKRSFQYGSNTQIGINCYVDALSTGGIRFGNNVSVGKNTTIECTGSLKELGKGLAVGDNTGLGSQGFFGCAGGIQIGSNTIMGNFVSFHSENHNYEDYNVLIRHQGVNRKGIKVGSNCWIGAKATILDGANIADGCIIAAGAVITAGDYKENGIYGGVPARFIKLR